MSEDLGRQILSDLKLYSDYLKWREDKQKYETWNEAVDDVLNTHILKYGEKVRPLIDKVKPFYRAKKLLASQRNLQFRGKQILAHESRLYNCCVTYGYTPDIFEKAFYVLLCGCGLGVSLKKKYVKQLPKISTRKKGTQTFIIPDSIEGLAKSVKVLISSYCKHPSLDEKYYGYSIRFDYSLIRPEGAMINGGFKAPGHSGLKSSLEKIEILIESQLKLSNNVDFKSIIVYDILMHISDAVLSGGVRRSAMSVIMDFDDEDLLHAKTGNWRQLNPQRARSNNSVSLLKGVFTKEDFRKLIDLNNGENDVGFVFVNHEDEIQNPCFEINFNFYQQIKNKDEAVLQFCVAGNTKLISSEGLVEIQDVVGEEIEIWNGQEWSKVKPYKTGNKDKLHRVWFNDGSYLDVTNNHKFLVKNRFQKEFEEVETLDLIKLLDISKYALQIPRSNVKPYGHDFRENKAYDYGFVLGDGFLDYNKVKANLFAEDKKLKFKTAKHFNNYKNYNDTEFETIIFNLDVDFVKKLKYDKGFPSDLFIFDRKSILEFIAGWADADGSKASKGIRIYGREDKIRDGQLLLTSVGINSSVNLMAKKGTKTNLGIRKNDVWYLQITTTDEIPCQRLVCNNTNKPKNKGKYQIIKKIDTLEGEHKSFCLTEQKLNQCVFNNVLTKQCNLTETNASKFVDDEGNFSEKEFYKVCEAASILGTLQAGYTNFSYINKQTEEVVAGEALLGVSITGWATRPELFNEEILKKGAEIVKETNEKTSKIIGINLSARSTTVKPSGNSATILQTASGIHPEHSKRYFRIMQLNKESEVAKFLVENYPETLEESVWSANNTDYVVFMPIENKDGVLLKNDLKGIKHLKLIELVQNSWVKYGKREENCYVPTTNHNVSNTVIIDDLNEIVDYIFDHQENFTAVSFVSEFGDKDYNQAPFTSVLTSQELLDKYGDGAVFASGLVVDGLHYFKNLWEATDTLLIREKEITGTKEQILLKKDWLRRARKFAKNYFGGNIEKMVYALKDIHLWHKWNAINKILKPIDFAQILKKPQYTDISKYGAISCSGGSCEVI